MRSLVTAAIALSLACGDDEPSSSAGASSAGGAGGSGASTPTSSSMAGGAGAGGAAGGAGGSGAAGGAPPIDCAPLPESAGPFVDVTPADAEQLSQIVFDAAAGSTIRLAPGTYPLTAILQVRADGVTLRSQNNDAASVVLDGSYAVNELIQVTANDVTLAHVTLTRSIDHLVHAFPPGDGSTTTGLRIYGVRLIDGGEQFVKVNPVGDGGFVDDGRVECSHFEMTEAGRPNVEACCGGCYTGGIDVHAGWGWSVSRNYFEGIYCENGGLAEHAVHFWKGARDTVVEDNTIINCARGVGFGLGNGAGDRVYPDAPHGGQNLAHFDGIIRNNFIWADIDFFDTGIEAAETREPMIAHNTVVTPGGAAFFSSIDYRFSVTSVVIKNNLTTTITQRDGATGDVSNNLENTPLTYFVDGPSGDLHLVDDAPLALDAGTPLGEVTTDIDGDARSMTPDLGADER